MLSINRTENFEIAHDLYPYDGKCYSLHGHSYKVTVEVSGPQDDVLGMVVDFNILKQVIKESIPDHAYIYDTNLMEDNNPKNIVPKLVPLLIEYGMNVVGYDRSTTCENLVQIWADDINRRLVEEYDLPNVYVSKLTANETQNSQAVYVPVVAGNPYANECLENYLSDEEIERLFGPEPPEEDDPLEIPVDDWNDLMDSVGGLDNIGLEVD